MQLICIYNNGTVCKCQILDYDSGMSPQTIQSNQLLQKHGLKVTRPRQEILRFLSSNAGPVSVDVIFTKLKQKGIDRVTIYRVIKTFEKSNLIRKVDLGHNHAHYELLIGAEHHHIICTNCGRIEELYICIDSKTMQNALRQAKDFAKITKHSFEIFALCKKCAAQ